MNDRSKTIGSSEIAAIMGLNKYMTPIDVWKRKTGRAEEFEGNAATERGLLLEPVVAQWFMKEKEIEVKLAQMFCKLANYPCSATPDYFYWIDTEPGESKSDNTPYTEARGILEIKTTRFRVCADDIPQSWFLQAQYQAAVISKSSIECPIEEISLAWLDGDLAFGYTTFKVDDGLGQSLLNFAYHWWQRHIVQDVMPDPVNQAELAYKYPKDSGESIQASNLLQVHIEVSRDYKQSIAETEKKLDESIFCIKELMQDKTSVMHGDNVLCTWKASKPRKIFDSKRFQAENPELYEKYLQEVPGNRVFLLKPKKE